VLIDRGRIAERVSALGDEVVRGVNGPGAAAGELVLVPILTGALVFTADLIRHMRAMLSLRLVTVSSYPGATVASKGARIRGELPVDLGGKHVVVVDDILDTGQTLSVVAGLIRELGPASLRVCVLLRKPGSCRKTPFEAEHVGFEIPDAFVVGYGLDYDGYYRNLPDIAELEFVAGG
jgi:hypoxanthine phosphoribosyltransferase